MNLYDDFFIADYKAVFAAAVLESIYLKGIVFLINTILFGNLKLKLVTLVLIT